MSPRSLLEAIREAAVDLEEHHQRRKFVLRFESIKRGVQRASKSRIGELREDYPFAESS